jgi:hypothetical protein
MITPGDPAPLVKAALITYLGSGARVVRDVPNTYDQAAAPLVLVADDGGPMDWPIFSQNTIRVTVFAKGLSAARALAGRCLGFLHENPLEGIHIHRRRGSTALVEARDPKTGADMASFTVTATVRTQNTV